MQSRRVNLLSYLFLGSLQKFFVHIGTNVSAVAIVFHQFKNVILNAQHA